MREVNDVSTMKVTRSLAMSADASRGAMICVKGDAIGSMAVLQDDRKMIVGRDPFLCSVVLSNPKVSRRHLEITYIGNLKKYRVVDYSSNGTYFSNKNRLVKSQEYYLAPGTELWLGSGETRYKLR